MQSKEHSEQDQMGKMVEVARFESPVEAQIAKGMLESAGIECELTGENANQLTRTFCRIGSRTSNPDIPCSSSFLLCLASTTRVELRCAAGLIFDDRSSLCVPIDQAECMRNRK